MLNIAVIAVGKMKNKNLASEAAELLKRLSPYAKIRVEEIAAEPFRQESDKQKAKKAEAEKIIKALLKYPQAEAYFLDERGAEKETAEFAKLIAKAESSQLVFIIGGTLGFDEKMIAGRKTLALSRLTLTHETAKLLLIEQIYRAACINLGKDYHY